MNRFSHSWANAVIAKRWLTIAVTLVVLVVSPLSYNRLYHDNSNESYFLEHDPNLIAFNDLVEKFGDPEYLLVGVPARARDADVFEAETIKMIDGLTRFLENHRHVTQVRSLSKYQYTHYDNGMLATDDLFEDVDALADEPELLKDARKVMAGEQLALETLITRDFKHTQIIARTTYLPGENHHKVELVHELQAFIEENSYLDQGYQLHLSGMPVIGERFETLTQNDMAWLNPTMMVIMVVILFIIFRSVFATLVPLITIISTMLIITSIQGVMRWPFTAVNSALIPTTIILSVGASIHVLVEFFQFRRDGKNPKDAAVATINDLFFAVLFTCVTTSVGFISLSVTDLSPVRQFAALAALAPMVIFLLVMATLPAVLSFIPWMPRNNKTHADMEKNNSPVNRLINAVPEFSWRNRKLLAGIGLVLALFSAYGVSQIRVDSNVVNYFKESSWINRDLLYFNEHFKGISNLEIVVDTGEEGGVKNPAVLQRVEALQAWLYSHEEIGKPTSVVDFYKQINQALNEDKPEFFTLPTSRKMAAQFLLLYENTGPEEDLTDLKDFNERYLRVRVPVINMNETKVTALTNELKNGIAERFPDLALEFTGTLVMLNAQNHYVSNGMFQSFSIAILMIGCCFILLFRSFKYGVIALVPSIVPVLITGGVVAMMGISLDLGTMIVGAMTIGIAVDDAIHLMSRYLLLRRRGKSVRAAIEHAMRSSGRAVVLTSIILVTGFSVMLLGSFVSYIYVGLFSAMIMSLALLGDLIFMPAILYLVDGGRDEVQALETLDNDAPKEVAAPAALSKPVSETYAIEGVENV